MKTNILEFKTKDPFDLNSLTKLLKSLEDKERFMVNPLLKDWFAIRNDIRKLKNTIGAMKNGSYK